MLGKWGKAVCNSLAHKGLFASPHFSQYKRCWGSGGSGVGEWGSGVGKWVRVFSWRRVLTWPKGEGGAFGLWPKVGACMAKRAFGHPPTYGRDAPLAMRWPKSRPSLAITRLKASRGPYGQRGERLGTGRGKGKWGGAKLRFRGAITPSVFGRASGF